MKNRVHAPKRGATARACATSIVRRLREAGHEAMFAGGCVRDMLMGRRPEDFDVATSAPPKVVTALFRRTRRVGAKFGVVLVQASGHSIEVATFRRDIDYADGRHPGRVEFTDAREDALRRDFTINGMFYDPIGRKVVDFVEGREDLEARRLRAIGEPGRRFAEDHLRLLRAIRFAVRKGFTIEPATWKALCEHAPQIARISPERIRAELEQIFLHEKRLSGFNLLRESTLLEHLWPGADQLSAHADSIGGVLAHLPKRIRFELGLAAMLFPLGAKAASLACDQLRCSNQCRESVAWLVERHGALMEADRLSLADLKLLMARREFADLLDLAEARLLAAGRSNDPVRKLRARARRIAPEDVAPPPLLDGHALARLGVPRGRIYKEILTRVYYAQLNGEIADRGAARVYAHRLMDSSGR